MPVALPLDPKAFLRQLFETAVGAADPAQCLPPHLPEPPPSEGPRAGRTLVIGAGKAAASMAQSVERHYRQHFPQAFASGLSGLVVTRYAHGLPCEKIEVIEAGHPVPDEASHGAARRLLGLLEGVGETDLVLCLISGGGSALLSLPAPGIDLAEKRAINAALLKAGAPIDEMNTVRKHLSGIKGGRLGLAAAPARVVTLAISDVPGDDPSVIASGPTLPDPSTRQEALGILLAYGIPHSQSVARHLAQEASETPKPGDPAFLGHRVQLIATPARSLKAAREAARSVGVEAAVLGDAIEGEAREVGGDHARLLAERLDRLADKEAAAEPPFVILSGGETTVTVQGEGRGGRNAEYLLGFGQALEALGLAADPAVYAFAGDTDGIDGTEENAGAFWTPTSLARASALGLSPDKSLLQNDAYGFFQALDDLLVTGPTRTNVNDFRALGWFPPAG